MTAPFAQETFIVEKQIKDGAVTRTESDYNYGQTQTEEADNAVALRALQDHGAYPKIHLAGGLALRIVDVSNKVSEPQRPFYVRLLAPIPRVPGDKAQNYKLLHVNKIQAPLDQVVFQNSGLSIYCKRERTL